MQNIAAFVGHSFSENDAQVVSKFLNYFEKLSKMDDWFSWDHAEDAAPKFIPQKVREKMESKNVFIGICTKKEFCIPLGDYKKCFLSNSIKVSPDVIKYKTSSWIIQEIGFAVAKDMAIIILAEDGIENPGGLQGIDLEYIPFIRGNEESSFSKILDMLSVLHKTSDISLKDSMLSKQTAESFSSRADDEHESENTFDLESLTSKEQFILQYKIALLQKDKQRASRINDYFIKSKYCDDIAEWNAELLYSEHEFNQEDVYSRIESLLNGSPDNPKVYSVLARMNRDFENTAQSAKLYSKAYEYELNDSKKLSHACQAALSYYKIGNYVEFDKYKQVAIDIYLKDTNKYLQYVYFCEDLFKEEKKDYVVNALHEYILSIRPDDFGRRFKAAYNYSEIGEQHLSLFHYNILSRSRKHSGDYNNLGVAEQQLNLKYESIRSYKAAADLGSTLASSNIAYKYISAGLLDEAKKICLTASSESTCDRRVYDALSQIEADKKSESENREKILDRAKLKSNFLIQFGHKATLNNIDNISNHYKSPQCDLDVNISNGIFSALGHTEVEEKAGLGILGIGSPITTKVVKTEYKYSGKIYGHAAEFSLNVTSSALQTVFNNQNKSEVGLLYFSDDLNTIHVYIKKAEENAEFYSLIREGALS